MALRHTMVIAVRRWYVTLSSNSITNNVKFLCTISLLFLTKQHRIFGLRPIKISFRNIKNGMPCGKSYFRTATVENITYHNFTMIQEKSRIDSDPEIIFPGPKTKIEYISDAKCTLSIDLLSRRVLVSLTRVGKLELSIVLLCRPVSAMANTGNLLRKRGGVSEMLIGQNSASLGMNPRRQADQSPSSGCLAIGLFRSVSPNVTYKRRGTRNKIHCFVRSPPVWNNPVGALLPAGSPTF